MASPPTLPWRHTPLLYSPHLSKTANCSIYLKLENLQPSGSFKSRGIGNLMLSTLPTPVVPSTKTHFYSSSGGNAGLACVHASVSLKHPCTIVVPTSTSVYMIGKLRKAGATEVLQHGESWYEADAYLRGTVIPEAEKKGEHAVYVPPFDARAIWEGNATLVEEVVGEIGVPNAVVCSVGGGGLFSGVMLGREQLGKQGEGMKVVAVETEGADSLSLSLRNGELSTLPAITSVATSLGARTVARQAFEYAQLDCVRSVVLSDRDAMGACVRFADEERMMVETACGVCLALCYQGRLRELVPELTEESNVVVVVCGGSNITEGMLHAWAESLKGRDE